MRYPTKIIENINTQPRFPAIAPSMILLIRKVMAKALIKRIACSTSVTSFSYLPNFTVRAYRAHGFSKDWNRNNFLYPFRPSEINNRHPRRELPVDSNIKIYSALLTLSFISLL